jgi:hypothetical protein
MSEGTARRTWHVDDDALRDWVDGVAGALVSASVEQHVQRCARCRHTVSTLLPPELHSQFDRVLAAVEVPAPRHLERLLVRLRLTPSDARVVAAAPALRAPWIGSMVGVVAFVALAALLADVGGLYLFLLVAPLVPVAGVVAAYGPSSDPMYEVVLVAPYATVRIVLLRAALVLATSVPLVVAAGLPLPGDAVVAIAWLLPAAGFIAVVLMASIWVDPLHAGTTLAVGWTVAVMLAIRGGDPLAVLAPLAMACYAGLIVVAGLVLLHRLLGSTPSWRLR